MAVSAAIVLLSAGPAAAAVGSRTTAETSGYAQTNLVSDQPGKAALTDPNLINPWGMSRGPDSPIWVSDFGTNKSTLYTGANGSTPPSTVGLVVDIPGGPPTGQVFNDTTGFRLTGGGSTPAKFIFASIGGDITAWNGGTSAVLTAHVNRAAYTGLALAHGAFGPLLLAANFAGGTVDVFDASFNQLDVPLLFHDPRLPTGYAPFNVTVLAGQVYVAYAKVNPATGEDDTGLGHGVVDVYTSYGALVRRLVTGSALDSPWGLAIAPAQFGKFSNDLLVGNFGNGRINAFDPTTGRFLGALTDKHGRPIVIFGLWALLVGDNSSGGPNSVWFSAGPGHEKHGLVGLLTAN